MMISLITCTWPLQMHQNHFKRCPRFASKILGTWSFLKYTPTWGCLGFGITRTKVIGSLVLLGTCWQFSYGIFTLFWIILGLPCWWRLLGLVHNATALSLIPLWASIASSSLYFLPYLKRRCSCIPLMPDYRGLSYMSRGYPKARAIHTRPSITMEEYVANLLCF